MLDFCGFFFIFMLIYYIHFTNTFRRRVYMACKKETVPFSGTPEQEAALKKVIAELKDTQGALMPIMQQAQDIYGYLPIEVQTMISDETGIPLEKIYGVSTFYSQFALQPKGKYQISVCLGTACYVKGSGAIFSKLEELLGITNGECTPDRAFFTGFVPLCRRLRTGSRHDDQRRSLRTAHPGRHSRHPCQISIAYDAGNFLKHP